MSVIFNKDSFPFDYSVSQRKLEHSVQLAGLEIGGKSI
jgi:hypothetical protein